MGRMMKCVPGSDFRVALGEALIQSLTVPLFACQVGQDSI